MKSNKAKSMILLFSLLFVCFVGLNASTAHGQGRRGVRHRPPRVIVYRRYDPFWYRRYDPFWDPFYRRSVVVDPIAYQREQGYREGKSEGEEDAKKGRLSEPTGHKDYLNSDSLAFRESFVTGYREGYREELSETTEEMREKGQKRGKEDAEKGRPADPRGHKDYLKATSRAYREAFVRGYNERYREQVGRAGD